MYRIIEKSSIQKVKSSFNIGHHIGTYTLLEREGKSLVGPSPFVKDDEERSLSVDVRKGRFWCSASGLSGDIIAFERAASGLSFPAAVEYLAMLRGIELEYKERKPKAEVVEKAA